MAAAGLLPLPPPPPPLLFGAGGRSDGSGRPDGGRPGEVGGGDLASGVLCPRWCRRFGSLGSGGGCSREAPGGGARPSPAGCRPRVGSDLVGSAWGRLDPAGSGLRWPGFVHVWRRGCSGPSLWWCREQCFTIKKRCYWRWSAHRAKVVLLSEPAAATLAGGDYPFGTPGKPMFQVGLGRTMTAHFVSRPFLNASSGFGSVGLVAARCGSDGGGSAASLGSMVVCALLARRWCPVCMISALPCVGMGLIFIRSRVSGGVILLKWIPSFPYDTSPLQGVVGWRPDGQRSRLFSLLGQMKMWMIHVNESCGALCNFTCHGHVYFSP